MRTAVIDIGSNSIRLLVADIEEGTVSERHRESRVTRLARGVERDGELSLAGVNETTNAIRAYQGVTRKLGAARVVAIATSAIRDAADGHVFLGWLRDELELETRLLEGREEARLTYLGARAGRSDSASTLVCDIGGGSTELIAGRGDQIEWRDSLQLGVVRQSERHLSSDPPDPSELAALRADADALITKAMLSEARAEGLIGLGIAVAGTPTSLAAIDLELDPYDPERVHGHVLSRARIEAIHARLCGLAEAERRGVTGLHPDRAPTIPAGAEILLAVMDAFALERVEVSEHDILWGTAIELAHQAAGPGDEESGEPG